MWYFSLAAVLAAENAIAAARIESANFQAKVQADRDRTRECIREIYRSGSIEVEARRVPNAPGLLPSP